jgi:hypothetical protein
LIVTLAVAAAPRLAISDPELCEQACHQVSQCGILAFEGCYKQCKDTGAERANPQGLQAIAHATCEQLAAAMPKTPAPATKSEPAPASAAKPAQAQSSGKRQWQCWASGSWKSCDSKKPFGSCYTKPHSAFMFGSTEVLARMAAETECNSFMSRMMTASFATRNSIVASCRVTSCTPP